MEGNITIEIEGRSYDVFFYREESDELYSAVVDNDRAFDFWEEDAGNWEFTPTNDREEAFRSQVVSRITNSPEFKT